MGGTRFVNSSDPVARIERVLAEPFRVRSVFQPQMSLQTGLVVGYELLTRFEGPPEPAGWFADARRVGLGAELDLLALRIGLSAARRRSGLELSVNLGPTALLHPGLHGILPTDLHGLVVEVTEHELVLEYRRVRPQLEALRRRGARIAIDDAGTGYAGLRQLVELAPDIVKLDRGLVSGIDRDPAKVALTEALVRFADSRGALVCAEGIETLEELRVLADLDVALGQGFVIARPAAAFPAVHDDAARICSSAAAAALAGVTAAGTPRSVHGFEVVGARLADAASPEELRTALAGAAALMGVDELELRILPRDDPEADLRPAARRAARDQRAIEVLVGGPEPDLDEVAHLIERTRHRAVLLQPAVVRGRVVALLEAYRLAPVAWSRTELARVRLLSHMAAVALSAIDGSSRTDAAVPAQAPKPVASTAPERRQPPLG